MKLNDINLNCTSSYYVDDVILTESFVNSVKEWIQETYSDFLRMFQKFDTDQIQFAVYKNEEDKNNPKELHYIFVRSDNNIEVYEYYREIGHIVKTDIHNKKDMDSFINEIEPKYEHIGSKEQLKKIFVEINDYVQMDKNLEYSLLRLSIGAMILIAAGVIGFTYGVWIGARSITLLRGLYNLANNFELPGFSYDVDAIDLMSIN